MGWKRTQACSRYMQINSCSYRAAVCPVPDTHEHKHAPWLGGLLRRWKDGCGKSCGEVNEECIPAGQATVFALVIDKCLFVTCGGQAQKAASVIFNVQPC